MPLDPDEGPAVAIALVVVSSVVREYAAGPASTETAATVPATRANQRVPFGRTMHSSRVSAAIMPVTTTVGPSQVS